MGPWDKRHGARRGCISPQTCSRATTRSIQAVVSDGRKDDPLDLLANGDSVGRRVRSERFTLPPFKPPQGSLVWAGASMPDGPRARHVPDRTLRRSAAGPWTCRQAISHAITMDHPGNYLRHTQALRDTATHLGRMVECVRDQGEGNGQRISWSITHLA